MLLLHYLPLRVPMLQAVWRHCPRGLFLRKLAKETSAQTLTCWKITCDHIQNTRIYLRNKKEPGIYFCCCCCATAGGGGGVSIPLDFKPCSLSFCHSPGWKWFFHSSPPEKEQYDISSMSQSLKVQTSFPSVSSGTLTFTKSHTA